MKIQVEISDEDVKFIQTFLDHTRNSDQACSHGPLDIARLASMLMEDVALMVRRPGSWEGAGMAEVLRSHGYL